MYKYAVKGDESTIDSPDRKTLPAKQHGNGCEKTHSTHWSISTFQELTNDLTTVESVDQLGNQNIQSSANNRASPHNLDFVMGELHARKQISLVHEDVKCDRGDIYVNYESNETKRKTSLRYDHKKKVDHKNTFTHASQSSSEKTEFDDDSMETREARFRSTNTGKCGRFCNNFIAFGKCEDRVKEKKSSTDLCQSHEEEKPIATSVDENSALSEGDEYPITIRDKGFELPIPTTTLDVKKNDNHYVLRAQSLSNMNYNKICTEREELSRVKDVTKSTESNVDNKELEIPTSEIYYSKYDESKGGIAISTFNNNGSNGVERENSRSTFAVISSKDAPMQPVSTRKHRIPSSVEIKDSILLSNKYRKKTKNTAKPIALLQDNEWIRAADVLFVKTEDKSAVTVKQIFSALEQHFDCRITKKLKTIVRDRLKSLMSGTVKPSYATSESEDHKSDRDDLLYESQIESENSFLERTDSFIQEDITLSNQKEKQVLFAKNKIDDAAQIRCLSYASYPRRRKTTTQSAAKVAEGHKLRQMRRAEESKVRNEEMQLDQTKDDEERQEAIAAKFQTNTDELRLKRLEDRLNLLYRLDEKRISVVADMTKVRISHEVNFLTNQKGSGKVIGDIIERVETNDHASNAHVENNCSTHNTDEEFSSDEEDLSIVGIKKPFKPLGPLNNYGPSFGLQVLEKVNLSKNCKRARRRILAGISKSDTNVISYNESDCVLDDAIPLDRNIGTRYALRCALKKKQKKQGNCWLARELGYKTEEEHLKDCQNVANKKRVLVLKLEQERLRTNERKQLRERLSLKGKLDFIENSEEDFEDEEFDFEGDGRREMEDDEMKVVKEIEQEVIERQEIENKSTLIEKEHNFDISGSSLNAQGIDSQISRDQGERVLLSAQGNTVKEALTLRVSAANNKLKGVERNLRENKPSNVEDNEEKYVCAENDEARFTGSPSTNLKSEDVIDGNIGKNLTEVEQDNVPDDCEETEKRLHDGRKFVSGGEGRKKDEKHLMSINTPKNAGWRSILEREKENLLKRKKRDGGLVADEAEEEEQEEIAGLEDFGFSILKKDNTNGENDDFNDQLEEEDLKHVVDNVSDDEGDEIAGLVARKRLEQQQEIAHHKEILRRMREGYTGRRGGISGGGTSARGMHRFDQLVSADNRDDAKRLGLLNDDEIESEDETEFFSKSNKQEIDNEDEIVLLDKMLKDRFLHRSDMELEEDFSEDEQAEFEINEDNLVWHHDEDTKTQERLAKRFVKRARIQRLEEIYGDVQEFTQQRLMDEDIKMKEELSKMRCGLVRRSSSASRSSFLSCQSIQKTERSVNLRHSLRNRQQIKVPQGNGTIPSNSVFQKTVGSLSIALRANQKRKHRTSFLGVTKGLACKESAL